MLLRTASLTRFVSTPYRIATSLSSIIVSIQSYQKKHNAGQVRYNQTRVVDSECHGNQTCFVAQYSRFFREMKYPNAGQGRLTRVSFFFGGAECPVNCLNIQMGEDRLIPLSAPQSSSHSRPFSLPFRSKPLSHLSPCPSLSPLSSLPPD